MSEEERWAVVSHAPNYRISSFGNARSVDHVIVDKLGRSFRKKGRPLKWGFNHPGGHAKVPLGSGNPHYIHRLVAEAFLGPCPEGMEVCHIDGNSLNNHVSNLRYDTHRNNMADMFAHGTVYFGSAHHMAKFSEEDVLYIRAKAKEGVSDTTLARMYNVSRGAISQMRRRITWPHVPDHEGQSGDTLCGATIRANVALSSTSRGRR